jgi:hypothetical protein
MLKKSLIYFSLLVLLLPLTFAQGRGGGGGQGQGAGMSQGQGHGQGASQGQYGTQAGDTQRDQDRIRVTSQQRDQIRTCDKLADGLRKGARTMSKSGGSKFNAAEARQQQNQIRENLRTMQQEHERLMSGLDSSQQQALQERIRNMNQAREQMNVQMQDMDKELASPNPDAKRVTERAQEMERIMNTWRNEYKAVSAETE